MYDNQWYNWNYFCENINDLCLVTFFDKRVDLESNNGMSFLDTPLCQLVHEDDDNDSLSPSLNTDININNANENNGNQQSLLNEKNIQ